MQEKDNTVYTISEVAEMLQKHPQTIRYWIKNKKLRAMKVGEHGQYMIKSEDLEEALDFKPD